MRIKFDKKEEKEKIQKNEDFLQGSLVSVSIQCGEAETVQECTWEKKKGGGVWGKEYWGKGLVHGYEMEGVKAQQLVRRACRWREKQALEYRI